MSTSLYKYGCVSGSPRDSFRTDSGHRNAMWCKWQSPLIKIELAYSNGCNRDLLKSLKHETSSWNIHWVISSVSENDLLPPKWRRLSSLGNLETCTCPAEKEELLRLQKLPSWSQSFFSRYSTLWSDLESNVLHHSRLLLCKSVCHSSNALLFDL